MKKLYVCLTIVFLSLLACTNNSDKTKTKSENVNGSQANINYDWSIWKGPSLNGMSAETDWKTELVTDPKSVKWTFEAGFGYSNVSTWESKVYTMGFASKKDTVFCLNEADGKVIWQYSYASRNGEYSGTRCTPVIFDNIVYTLSRVGIVTALDATSGTLVWQKDLVTVKSDYPIWGYASSAVIYKDAIILNAGKSGLALNRKTGSVIWKTGPGIPGYASPVFFKAGSKDSFLIFSKTGLYCVAASNGKELWYYEWIIDYDINAADPVLLEDGKIFISTGSTKGCALLQADDKSVKTIWVNNNLCTHYHSAFYVDKMLIGIDRPGENQPININAIDSATGNLLWSQPASVGAMTIAGNRIIFASERGTISVAEFSRVGYKEIVTGLMIKQLVWTSPVISNGQLYVRNDKGLLLAIGIK